MPEISVIMSVYNLEDKNILEQSINSILNQTFKDFELIICDDGSTDGTWQILKKIGQKDERIRLIHNEYNRKAGYARNCCIKMAKGEYVAIMDADDISANNRLEMQYLYLQKNLKISFVGSVGEFFIEVVGDDGEKYWYSQRPKPKDFLFSMPFVHASLMFRKKVLEKVKGYDASKHVVRAEDYDLLLRLYQAGYYGYNLPEVLYYIRRDEAQYKRRKYCYRINETFVKWRGFYRLGLVPKGIIFAIKPLIVGLIPVKLLAQIQKKYYAGK